MCLASPSCHLCVSQETASHLSGSLHWAHHLRLLLQSLEAAMAELGSGVDELEIDLLESRTRGLGEKRLPESDDTLLDTSDSTLEHDVVLVDLAVVGEATNGGDPLDGQVKLCAGVVGGDLAISRAHTLGNAVHLLVDLGTMVVTVLASTGHGVGHTAGCQAPIQATFLRPLWVLRGRRVTPQ